ncbi:MAG: hypothetical protein ACODAU_06600 [Myxococcota bacterium]
MAALAAMAAGCGGGGGDATALVVLVEDCAGLAPNLVRVEATVEVGGEARAHHTFALEGTVATSVPFSFGIAPGDGGADERLTVTVEGFTAAGGDVPVVRYTATDTGFVDGQALLLDVCLDGDRTEPRPPGSLRVIDPGDELMRDAGTGMDGGTPDTGTPPVDSGTPDTGTPPGDSGVSCGTTCPAAVGLSLPGGRFNASVAGSSSHSGTCGGSGPEQIYTFTLDEPSDVFVSTHHGSVDTVVYVRSCHCNGTELGCNDDADGRESSALQLTDLPAGTYHAFVDTKEAMSVVVPVDIHVTPSGPVGDRCGRPIPLTGGSDSRSTCGMTNVNTGGSCEFVGSNAGPDRVYYVVVDSATTATFDTCSGADYDTSLLLSRRCLVQDEVACNDDDCGPAPERNRSRIQESLAPGLYYLWADGFYEEGVSETDCGNYTLNVAGL